MAGLACTHIHFALVVHGLLAVDTVEVDPSSADGHHSEMLDGSLREVAVYAAVGEMELPHY